MSLRDHFVSYVAGDLATLHRPTTSVAGFGPLETATATAAAAVSLGQVSGGDVTRNTEGGAKPHQN